MRTCRSCHYRLDGLGRPECPECGAIFDPADDSTFETHVPRPEAVRPIRWVRLWSYTNPSIADNAVEALRIEGLEARARMATSGRIAVYVAAEQRETAAHLVRRPDARRRRVND